MQKNLEVPYKSQWDADAKGTRNDCGPASIAMILNFYGERVTTDQVFKETGAGPNLITINQLQKAISAFGYTSHYEQNVSPQRIKDLIDRDTPSILLVHYGSLNSTQDKTFKGGHFFPVVGYYDDGYFVNDPNFFGEQRKEGDHHNYLRNELEKAWSDSVLDKNPRNALIWIERKQPTESTDQKTALKLVEEYRVRKNHGNLEGAVRGMLGEEERANRLQGDIDNIRKENATMAGALAAFLQALGIKKS
jgi:ABC-type bacteriocin/lantibiotic exporter with double-glycine peptidase domain